MHRLEIKLKQHTPMIHFQHDQEGATLRATEVKPKLDKYIIKTVFHDDFEKCKEFLVGYDATKPDGLKKKFEDGYRALDYKMRIEADNLETWEMNMRIYQDRREVNKKIALFFGNMHKKDDINYFPKKMSFTSSPISLIIHSKNRLIIEELSKNINVFFLLHNFGTRQSKGFGSFSLLDQPKNITIPCSYAKFEWKSKDKFGTWDCYYELFNALDLFYKTLRSGINQQGMYFKSLMYLYALDIGGYWDKRLIRYRFKHFKPNLVEDKGEKMDGKDGDINNIDARLYRDMLGLSSVQEWRYYSDKITKDHLVDDEKKKIQRFKSPLLIKPLYQVNGKFDILLIPMPIPKKYLNAAFNISSSLRGKGCDFTMKTPISFDTCDFIDYISDENIVDYVINILKKYLKNDKYIVRNISKTLISIYSSLKYYH